VTNALGPVSRGTLPENYNSHFYLAYISAFTHKGFLFGKSGYFPTDNVSRETRRTYLTFGRCLAFCFALACGFGFAVAFFATGFLVVAFLLTIILSLYKIFDHLQWPYYTLRLSNSN
jgi:hypothetical protein